MNEVGANWPTIPAVAVAVVVVVVVATMIAGHSGGGASC